MPALTPPAGIAGVTIVAITIGIATFGTLLSLYRAFSSNGLASERARSYIRRRREPCQATLGPARATGRQKSVGVMRRLLERLKLTRGEEVRKATELLAQAGWRTPDALTIFLSLRLAMPLGLGILAYILAPSLMAHATPSLRMLAGLAGIAAGAFAPSYFVKNASQKRQRQIQKALPDTLDLFVICSEAGLGLDTTIVRVGREIASNAPELADELSLTGIELGFLPNRRDALFNLTKRADTPSMRALVNTLVQTERYGTPLAQSLRMLAGEFRNLRMMKVEEKAARLPAILTVPMIVFILPALFVVLIGPAIIQVLSSLH
jgi:tight adherence protein C